MKKYIIFLAVFLFVHTRIVYSNEYAFITKNAVNITKSTNTVDANVLYSLKEGDFIEIIESIFNGDIPEWYKVKINNQLGWITDESVYICHEYKSCELLNAIANNNIQKTKNLITQGVEVNSGMMRGEVLITPLIYAIQKGNNEIINLLLENGVQIDSGYKYSDTPLTAAIKSKNIKIVKLLIKNGADVNKGTYANYPLRSAIRINNIEIVGLLIGNSVDIPYNDLLLAVSTANIKLVDIILSTGITFKNYPSPLPEAVHVYYPNNISEEERIEMIDFLLSKGLSIDGVDAYNSTVLMHAAQNRFFNIVKLLIKNNADINLINNEGHDVFDILEIQIEIAKERHKTDELNEYLRIYNFIKNIK